MRAERTRGARPSRSDGRGRWARGAGSALLLAAVAALGGAVGCFSGSFSFTNCASDRDCRGGTKCWHNLLGATCETVCSSDAQCAPEDYCNKDATFSSFPICEAGCRSDDQCGQGSVCNSGTCGPGCHTNDQCPEGQACRHSSQDGSGCVPGCRVDGDCATGSLCMNTECVVGACRTNADCSSGEFCGLLDALTHSLATFTPPLCTALPASIHCGASVCAGAAFENGTPQALSPCCPSPSGDACGFDFSGLASAPGCLQSFSGSSDPSCGDETSGSITLQGCRTPSGACGHFLDERTPGDALLGCFVGI